MGYIRRLVSLWRSGKSGIFQVRFGRRRQRLFVLSGGVVACQAYMESDAERSVRLVGPEGIGAAMSWATGEWSFQPMPPAAVGVDPRLLPEGAMAEVWRSVCQNLPASEAMVALSERGDEVILPGPELADCLPAFALPEPLDGLVEAVGTGASVEVLFRAFPDHGPELARAIWMLDAAGLLDPDDGAYLQCVRALMDVRPVEEAASVVSEVRPRGPGGSREPSEAVSDRPPARPAPKAPGRDLVGVLAAEHARRIGRDYYGFLGVAANAPQLLVNRLCKRYVQRWRSASANHSLPDGARAQAQDLLAGIQQVSEVLTDPVRREDYDRLLARGSAPVVGASEVLVPEDSGSPSGLQPVDVPPPTTSYERGRLLLERGEYAAAVRYLQRARMDAPSEPDILADLGWATWMLQGTDEIAGGEEPEEYIRLAMTFDRLNPRALEYLARIAMAGEDRDEQQRRLKDLLRVAPEIEWAREALKSLMFTRKDPAVESGGRSLLFWRKGSSH